MDGVRVSLMGLRLRENWLRGEQANCQGGSGQVQSFHVKLQV
jgi:hypothetical protein